MKRPPLGIVLFADRHKYMVDWLEHSPLRLSRSSCKGWRIGGVKRRGRGRDPLRCFPNYNVILLIETGSRFKPRMQIEHSFLDILRTSVYSSPVHLSNALSSCSLILPRTSIKTLYHRSVMNATNENDIIQRYSEINRIVNTKVIQQTIG